MTLAAASCPVPGVLRVPADQHVGDAMACATRDLNRARLAGAAAAPEPEPDADGPQPAAGRHRPPVRRRAVRGRLGAAVGRRAPDAVEPEHVQPQPAAQRQRPRPQRWLCDVPAGSGSGECQLLKTPDPKTHARLVYAKYYYSKP